MKRTTTLFFALAILINVAAVAQTTRMILVEEFTNASCPPCAAYNPAFNAILNNNPNNVVAVKYQVNWPGADPMNAHNPTEVASMVSYYGVSGVPNAVLDGNVWQGNPASFTQTMINNRAPVASPFAMTVDHSFSPDYSQISITGTITATQAFGTATNLRVAIIERDIYFCSPAGSNGETHFEGVMKKMLPNQNGTVMPAAWTQGQVEYFNFTWNLANVYDKTRLAVVAWVYNPQTKEVQQAAFSPQQGMPDDARITCAGIGGIPLVNCTNVITPTVEIQNNGLNVLTSLNINYTLNGGTPNNYAWTGNLAAGSTAVVTLPTMNVNLGANSLMVNVTEPNGTIDYNTYYDQVTKNFTIANPTGTPVPLVQNFVPTTFPPPGWVRDNPDNGATWTRNAAGYTNAGSAKMDFYNSTAGNIDELWVEAQDFSGASAIQLDFDVAYAPYSSTLHDRLQVQVSTNCGQTWTTVYDKANLVLATVPAQTSAFTPTSTSQWRHETTSLNAFAGQSLVFVKFKGISGYGNNLYVDNINFADPLGVTQNAFSKGISLYPSPSSGKVNISINLDKVSPVTIEVYSIAGEKVAFFNEGMTAGTVFNYDLTSLSNGLYTVKIIANDETAVKQLQIVK
ncbi:MAG: Omp28-related outer membrane protein [Bacteroidia bacterium]|nr:Omp28-related outer membrane protein [Bacteroidia bacterium]